MKRFLRKILILCLILLAAAVLLDAVFTRIFRNGLTYKSQWISNMHGRHYDVVFAGSSRAYWNIDNGEISRRCGLDVISLANSGYSPSEILLALKVFLANDNTTDRLYLQVDYHTLSDQRKYTTNAYDYLPYLKDPVVYDHLKERSTEFQLLKHLPFARYGRYNFIWGPEEAMMTVTGLRNTIFDSTGSFFTDIQFRGDGMVGHELNTERPPKDLQAIIDLCRSNNIQVELYMTPYYRLRTPEGTEQKLNQMIDRWGLVMHDLSQTLDSAIYFDDNSHLSRKGGEIFSQMLIDHVVCPEKESNPVEAK